MSYGYWAYGQGEDEVEIKLFEESGSRIRYIVGFRYRAKSKKSPSEVVGEVLGRYEEKLKEFWRKLYHESKAVSDYNLKVALTSYYVEEFPVGEGQSLITTMAEGIIYVEASIGWGTMQLIVGERLENL